MENDSWEEIRRDRERLKSWITKQSWYQTIELSNGLVTPGNLDTRPRIEFLEGIDFRDQTVLDIGCNSGQFCMYAKKQGARRVMGIDINRERLEQARKLADVEGLEIEYYEKGLFDIADLEPFDVVFCFAVLTEISDFFGALEVLKQLTKGQAYIELDLAKPLCYISYSRNWIHKAGGFPRHKAVAEIRHTKHGFMVSPSFEVFKEALGSGFAVASLGRGVRYEMIHIYRTIAESGP
ncbi:tRNA U34 carboxymethyltransferase [subsurface metagenome]